MLYYTKAGFQERPLQVLGRQIQLAKAIDACLIGTFQAPSSAQKNVVLAFRGTVADWAGDWLNDAEIRLVPFIGDRRVYVHKGFNDSIASFYGKGIVGQIQSRLKNPGSQLYITGHSKGGALAYLAALLLARKHPDIPVAGVISFEAPRPGHPNFVDAYSSTGIDTLRYEFQDDVVPHVPPTGIFATALSDVLKMPAVPALALSFLYPKTAHSLEYKHAGRLRFTNWNGDIVDDYPSLEGERSKHLTAVLLELLASGGTQPRTLVTLLPTRLAALHSIACGSGSWRAVCKTEVCP